jgi:hypothetical protein
MKMSHHFLAVILQKLAMDALDRAIAQKARQALHVLDT